MSEQHTMIYRQYFVLLIHTLSLKEKKKSWLIAKRKSMLVRFLCQTYGTTHTETSTHTYVLYQTYGTALYRMVWVVESRSHVPGFRSILTQTVCFLLYVSCRIKQTGQKCKMKSVSVLGWLANNGFSIYLFFVCLSLPHEDLTSLGQDVLPLKLHGEFPSSLPT